MNRSLDLACAACCAALAIVLAGCQAAGPSVRKAGAVTDPCAERLHDICGHLLLYYSLNRRLPDDLADLKSTDSGQLPPLVCPVSGRPYIYNPDGLPVPGRPGSLVLYDASPSHSGMRWGVLAGVAAESQPLAARVVLLPETPVFSAKKQQKTRVGP